MPSLNTTFRPFRYHKQSGRLTITLLVLLAVCLFSLPVEAQTSTYVFLPDQSTIVQTGGIAGVHETYGIEGKFQLTVDFDAGIALFDKVDANLTEPSGFLYTQSLSVLFNMTELAGTVVDDGAIDFRGKTSDDTNTDIIISLNFTDNSVHLTGETIPPPGSADFFYYNLDAVARRKYAGGTGEPNDPYLIYTAEQMNAIGAEPNDWDKHFKLMADIDLSRYTGGPRRPIFNIIGSYGDPFSGVFDGNGKKITNFTYSSVEMDHVGLFGYVTGSAKIENLGLVKPNILVGTGRYIGALIGYLEFADLAGCYVRGGKVSGDQDTGGLVGYTWGDVSDCHTDCEVSGTERVGGLIGTSHRHVTNSSSVGPVWGDTRVGGLIGFSEQPIDVICCYSTGTVTASSMAGGLVGDNAGMIKNCYAKGDVSGHRNIGGLVGVGGSIIWNCYSTGHVMAEDVAGGLIAYGRGEAFGCFWDVETSGQSESFYGTGKNTIEMKLAGTFTGWGCDSAWTIDEGVDYPRLRWENMPGRLITTPSFQDIAGSGTADDPYRIYTAQQLNRIGLFPGEWNRHYILQGDIDLSCFVSNTFNIIGSTYLHFTGVFDGNFHTISNFSYSKHRDCLGLFGNIMHPAVVKRVILVNPSIEMKGAFHAGSLVGRQDGSTISCCGVEGGSVRGKRFVGGLVGFSSGTITRCYANCNVSGDMEVGGLVGNAARANITDSYANGDVSAESKKVGGLVGWNSIGSISNCYSTGEVVTSSEAGGLVGAGYLIKDEDCLWDMHTSGQLISAAGTGLTTAEMQMASTFMDAGWDFVGETENGTEDIWAICEGTNYPKFVWQIPVGDFVCPDGISIEDFLFFSEHWRDDNCDSSNDYCDGTDLDQSGTVDINDLEIFFDIWLAGLRK